MNKEKDIFEQAIGALMRKAGCKVTWRPRKRERGTIDFLVKEWKMQFIVEVKGYVGAYHLDQIIQTAELHQPLMVVAENIAAPVRDKLRTKGIAYLEANGNAYIEHGHTFIFIDGNKPVREIKPVTNRAFTKTGLKAVFHLLNDPQAITRTYRQLAEKTGLALGNIKYVMDGINEAGFILPLDKKKMMLKNKKALLERWLAGYRETLKPDLLKDNYRLRKEELRDNWQAIAVKDVQIQWGGEAAAEIMTNYLNANILTIYAPAFTTREANALGLIPDNNGDVQVYEKFWRNNEDIGTLVPPLLVYADLLLTEDPRCIETAKTIYEKYLKDQIETD